jgi:hypothetical protein
VKADEVLRDKELMARAKRMTTPDGYAEVRLGMGLHPTQAAVLRALFPRTGKSRVVFRCANEVGKTRRVATAAVLYAVEILGAKVVSTAGVFRQVATQLVPSLKSYSHLFPDDKWEFLDRAIKRYYPAKKVWDDVYTGFSAKDDNYFQGYHKDEGMPLLIIIDESQGVRDEIFKSAEDRCNPTYYLACGSPADPSGMFYEMETSLASHYEHFRLTRPECTIDKGWWIDPQDLQRIIEKYGRENPFVRSTVFGEFSNIVEDALLSLGELEACLNDPPQQKPGDKHAFCDFAAGRAKNVFAYRIGNKVVLRKKWMDRNTMSACGEFIGLFEEARREHGFTPEEISGDADGLGLPMLDRLAELGWKINRFHGGSAPRFEDRYKNAIGEAWGEGAGKIIRNEIILPNDPEFKAQILSRKAKRNSSGKFELESKEDMVARGLASPDEADGVLGCMMPAPQVKPQRFANAQEPFESRQDPRGNDYTPEALPGFWAG